MLYISSFSYDDHLTYKIMTGDTVESVAGKLGVDIYQLRSYHNSFCPLEDCIGASFPNHLKFLILQPEEEKQVKEGYRERIKFTTKKFKLPFLPAHLDKKYLAMYTIENGNKIHSIKEEINVKWLATDPNNYSLIEIDRRALYIDENYSKSPADELAEKAASIFYPLKIVVDSNGDWVDVYNFDAIRDRWYKIRDKVLEEFVGKAVEERLNVYETKLEHDDNIREAFKNDWFLQAFFSGLNIEYQEALTFQNTISFPISHKLKDVKFVVEQTILPAVDQYNLVNITQKGILSDNRSKDDFENGLPSSLYILEEKESEKLQGTFEAHYFLDPNTNTTESLFLECSIEFDELQKITIVISNLDEKGKLTLETGNNLYIAADKKNKETEQEIKWMLIAIIVILALAVYGIINFYF